MRNITVLVFEGADLLDIAGPLRVFTAASEMASGAEPRYAVSVISLTGMGTRTDAGLLVSTKLAQSSLAEGVDTLLVAGGSGAAAAARDRALVHWLKANRNSFRRIGATSNGCLVLAASGLLDGRRATTHWENLEELHRGYPTIKVQENALFVEDGGVWTSAGVTAGIDMALAMVEADAGRGLALKTAKRLVLYLKRAGHEAQISAHLHAQHMPDDLRKLLEQILDNPREEYSVPQLVQMSGMSARSLYRLFYQQLKMTPREFVEMVRFDVAKRLLEDNGVRPGRVAEQAGFGSREAMRRSFQKRLGISPTAYRQKVCAATRTGA
ncbi:MAG: GlxA family transcriptional regulator [Alphaproteobacteria bacterium]